MTTHCPICFHSFDGNADAGIAPGDQLVDHLTDAHRAVASKHLREGVALDA